MGVVTKMALRVNRFVANLLFLFPVEPQIQSTSNIPCDPSLPSSPTNCDYSQYDASYAAKSQAQIDAAWTAIPGVTCGVVDPYNRPGQQVDSRKLMDMLENPFKFDQKRQRPSEQ